MNGQCVPAPIGKIIEEYNELSAIIVHSSRIRKQIVAEELNPVASTVKYLNLHG